MKFYHYPLLWIGTCLVSAFIVFQSAATISQTIVVDALYQFELVLIVFGFSAVMATMICCTAFIVSKLKQ